MLPLEAKTYFDSLLSAANADEWSRLAQRQKSFERDEFSRGRNPVGAGFASRLAALYGESLTSRANGIAEILKTVHQSFNSPLDQDVDVQLIDWGTRALSDFYQGLQDGFVRHLQRFQIDLAHASGLDHDYALARATVANVPGRYLWELRNVPAKQPQPATAVPFASVIINNNGTIGAVQTGGGSTANVQQQWASGDTSELRDALLALRAALERAQDVESEARRELIADVDSVTAELQQERPNKGRLLRWLGGIGSVVGAIGSVQPAYEAVRALARALGLPL